MHEIITGLVFEIYYPFIAATGVPANVAVIVILSRNRCCLFGCVIYYLVSMAVADLLVITTAVILNWIAGMYFPFSFLSITPLCSFRSAFNYAALARSAWLTFSFTLDRFVAISCQKLNVKYCTEKMAGRVIIIVFVLSCVKNTFTYFYYEPMYLDNNVPWFCALKPVFYTSPAWTAYDWIRSILTPCLPFILTLLLNVLTVRHILVANQARRRLRNLNTRDNQKDLEIEKRRKSIVLLFAISGSFILLNSLCFLTIPYVRVAGVTYPSGSDQSTFIFILQESGYMPQLLSSCINPFIYAGTQQYSTKTHITQMDSHLDCLCVIRSGNIWAVVDTAFRLSKTF
ncbi:probable G-protein coupled receptor 139 [Stegostoma tigrinum]|uniref:probable G-protein coupled receptor 139 n=1 Tax=Stegostoma tigrinum TaxID=3053191 RepID=UPI00286FD721|nr:probable G-protein coupled receptor 139 [Stegostoma tigrinum]